ncbi:MAG: hypothetical protein SFX18_09680 [Pirellulales bacterium]|nr:hypothetical protein [Pirellulales bacterium]
MPACRRDCRTVLCFQPCQWGITAPRQKLFPGILLGLLCWGAWLSLSPPCQSSEPAVNVTMIEEDWELVVHNPDPNITAPQISCVMSTDGTLDHLHAVLELNCHSQPEFSPGGIQLQVWNGDQLVAVQNHSNRGALANNSETIRWTMRMKLHDDNVTWSVRDVTSQTWGDFSSGLSVSAEAGQNHLNNYSAAHSQAKSGIGFASNRVHSLKITRVRRYAGTTLVDEQSQPLIVHEQE